MLGLGSKYRTSETELGKEGFNKNLSILFIYPLPLKWVTFLSIWVVSIILPANMSGFPELISLPFCLELSSKQ